MIEFNDQDSSVFDEVMAVLKHHSAFEQLRLMRKMLSAHFIAIHNERLVTARDAFSLDTPGEASGVDADGKSVYDIPELLRDWEI